MKVDTIKELYELDRQRLTDQFKDDIELEWERFSNGELHPKMLELSLNIIWNLYVMKN